MNDSVLRKIIGTIIVTIGCLATLGACCLVLDPWLGSRPFWPGLDMPPAGEALSVAEHAHSARMMIVVAVDLLFSVLLVIVGIAVLRRWRFMVPIAVTWLLGKLFLVAYRMYMTSSVLHVQIDAITDTTSAAGVNALAKFGMIGIAILRLGLYLTITVLLVVVYLNDRNRSTTAGPASRITGGQ